MLSRHRGRQTVLDDVSGSTKRVSVQMRVSCRRLRLRV